MRVHRPFFLVSLFFLVFAWGSVQGQDQDVYIRKILIHGNYSLTRQEVLDFVGIHEEQAVSVEKIRQIASRIQSEYRKMGYTLCEVEGWINLERDLVIQIYEGVIEDLLFLRLDYLQVFLIRDQFGEYRDKTFYQPLLDEKLGKVSSILRTQAFIYEFLPVEGKKGSYYLFVSKGTQKKNKSDTEEKEPELKPYTDIYFNFRGWLLSLVPYVYLTFYNIGGIDHSLRLSADIRFSTQEWLYLRDGISNEYYELNYFSPKVYGDMRINFYTGALINRSGRGDLGVGFKTIKFPFQLGVGYDFKLFWGSFRVGYLYEKLRNISLSEETLISETRYPELLKEKNEKYTYFSLNLSHWEQKKYIKEKDDHITVQLDYTVNEKFSWVSWNLDFEKFYIWDNDFYVFRYRNYFMLGNYPVYYELGLPNEFHLRGYGALFTNRGMDTSFEHWNSIYKDLLHAIFFVDAGWFNNMTYHDKLSLGDFALTYGLGLSYAYKEMNFRVYYALPLKQRADQGSFDWFFRRRF